MHVCRLIQNMAVEMRRFSLFRSTITILSIVWCLLPVDVVAEPTGVRQMVIELAEALASKPYEAPHVHSEAQGINYTDYLSIRVKPGQEIWAHSNLGFAVHPMPLGGLHQTAVEVNIIEGRSAEPVLIHPDLYEHSVPREKIPENGDLGISGFRITAPLNAATVMDELIVFQGASYFRALSRGQAYGLSARALTINAGQPDPEEFPNFTRYWIEKPHTRELINLHALLDSPSIAGAYSFVVRPGSPTVVDVQAVLFPRVTIPNVGFAPLTSMYFYSVADGAEVRRDYRPAVHDSDGLLMLNGRDERLWRPLRNPTVLRMSAFSDNGPKGFGLMQRQRKFEAYQDLEANYHRRPSAWVEPIGNWGDGRVELIELPTTSEFNDNVVAQWRPSDPLLKGSRYDLAYRIKWCDAEVNHHVSATVNWTRSGAAVLPGASLGAERFVIDYASELTDALPLPKAVVTTTSGSISGITVQRNHLTGSIRVSFVFEPGENETSEFRVSLDMPSGTSETWLYRWTKPTSNKTAL